MEYGPDTGKPGLVEQRPAQPSPPRSLADAVLRLIWRERRISRAEISQRLGLARSTVTEIVKMLLKTDFVAEGKRGVSSGGRRPVMLEFQDRARVILGVDVGATHVAVALTDLRGRVLAWMERRLMVRADPKGTLALIMELGDAGLAAQGMGAEDLLCVSVAFPSPVDPAHPEWLPETVIPGWRGQSGLNKLRLRYGVPVYVDNDANLGALAEHWWGAGRGVDDLIYVKLGHGIGAGYVLGGELYRGSAGVAGEIGHLPIDPNGKPCVCGLKGCLVKFVGASALEERARALLPDHPDSMLAEEELTVAAIEQAALAGDAAARQVVREAAACLGLALAGVVNLLNPRMVILGGGLAQVGELLVAPIREQIGRTTLAQPFTGVEVRTSELGAHAVAVGAATLALKTSFDTPGFFRRTSATGAQTGDSAMQ